jgi:hypothetical protein
VPDSKARDGALQLEPTEALEAAKTKVVRQLKGLLQQNLEQMVENMNRELKARRIGFRFEPGRASVDPGPLQQLKDTLVDVELAAKRVERQRHNVAKTRTRKERQHEIERAGGNDAEN